MELKETMRTNKQEVLCQAQSLVDAMLLITHPALDRKMNKKHLSYFCPRSHPCHSDGTGGVTPCAHTRGKLETDRKYL